MPFGLSSASSAFIKLLKPIVSSFRRIGIRLVIYLDDILLMNQCQTKVVEDFDLVVSVLQSIKDLEIYYLIRNPKSPNKLGKIVKHFLLKDWLL